MCKKTNIPLFAHSNIIIEWSLRTSTGNIAMNKTIQILSSQGVYSLMGKVIIKKIMIYKMFMISAKEKKTKL